MEEALLAALNSSNEIGNSLEFSQALNVNHMDLVSVINSLAMDDYVISKHHESLMPALTDKGKEFLINGAPEVIVWKFVRENPSVSQQQIVDALGTDVGKFGYSQAMKNKWLAIDKETKLISIASQDVNDFVQDQLKAFENKEEVKLDELRKRKLVDNIKSFHFSLTKGPRFAPTRQKPEAELTFELLRSGNWKTTTFKDYNFKAKGKNPEGGHLHPLLKVRSQLRNILLDLGFEEMPTNNFVVSSF